MSEASPVPSNVSLGRHGPEEPFILVAGHDSTEAAPASSSGWSPSALERIAALELQVSSLEVENEGLRMELEVLEEEAQPGQDQVSALEQELREAVEESRRAQLKTQKLESEAKGLRLARDDKEKLLAIEQRRHQELRAQTDSINRRFEKLEQENRYLRNSLAQRTAELAQKQQHVIELANALEQAIAAGQKQLVDPETLRLAFEDRLTGLPNANYLYRRLDECGQRVAGGEASAALLSLDLDRFRDLNQRLGRAQGDRLLREVAHRLRPLVEGMDTLCRLRGDNFAVVVFREGPPTPGHSRAALAARDLASRVLSSLRHPFYLEEQSVQLTASVGISLLPGDAGGAADLLGHAETAVSVALEEGGDRCQYYTHQLQRKNAGQPRISTELRQAHKRRELQLTYQPIVDLNEGRLAGFEAILSYPHPQHRLENARQVFAAADQDPGLLAEIGDWLLEEACAFLHHYRRHKVFISFNVNKAQILQPRFLDNLMRTIKTQRIRPDNVVLELDSAEMLADERVQQLIGPLVNWKVGVALDHLGADELRIPDLTTGLRFAKIDPALVRGLLNDARALKACIGICGGLNLPSIPTGVREAAELEKLQLFGCRMAQGEFFSPPVREEETSAMLKRTFNVPRPSL